MTWPLLLQPIIDCLGLLLLLLLLLHGARVECAASHSNVSITQLAELDIVSPNCSVGGRIDRCILNYLVYLSV